MSVAAISIPAISSDAGKTPAIPQDTLETSHSENSYNNSASINETNGNNRDKEKNNNSDHSNSGQLKKQNSQEKNKN
jgi:hypothetical protein